MLNKHSKANYAIKTLYRKNSIIESIYVSVRENFK